jgi:hypothetical protein
MNDMGVRGGACILVVIASGAAAQTTQDAITGQGRFNWVMFNTVGPVSLVAGTVASGWSTLIDVPPEYGTHWDGFGKRYGLRLTGIATSNTMEAGLGALWGEDPRYPRAQDKSFGARVRNVVKYTFLARNDYGETVPAYARYAGIAGGNFLSNTWRPNSEDTTGHTIGRIGLGFLGRMSSNALLEFWPDIRSRVFREER